MDEQRNLLDIFSSIHTIAKSREVNLKSLQKNVKCLCEKSSLDYDNLDLDNHIDEDIHETDILYIKKTSDGFKFAICPACNPQLTCRLCGGTGHMSFDQSYVLKTQEGQTEIHSEAIRPNACSCMRLQMCVQKLNNAQIPEKYIHADLHNIDLHHIDNNLLKEKLLSNIEKINIFCQNQDLSNKNQAQTKQKYFMTLFGPVGCGKTLLASAALKKLILNNNCTGKFIDFQYLLSQLRAQYDDHKNGEKILSELQHTDVLIIDEFGKGRQDKEWQLEKLDDLVNFRYNAQKITFITTNYLPPNLSYAPKDIPYQRQKDIYAQDLPINETFWQQSLSERVGMRMYERILEVSEFIDFTNLPSYRRFLGKSFMENYFKGS